MSSIWALDGGLELGLGEVGDQRRTLTWVLMAVGLSTV